MTIDKNALPPLLLLVQRTHQAVSARLNVGHHQRGSHRETTARSSLVDRNSSSARTPSVRLRLEALMEVQEHCSTSCSAGPIPDNQMRGTTSNRSPVLGHKGATNRNLARIQDLLAGPEGMITFREDGVTGVKISTEGTFLKVKTMYLIHWLAFTAGHATAYSTRHCKTCHHALLVVRSQDSLPAFIYPLPVLHVYTAPILYHIDCTSYNIPLSPEGPANEWFLSAVAQMLILKFERRQDGRATLRA